MRISEEELLEIHRWMVTERLLDEKVNSLFRMGKIMSMFHSALGQEAANVGAAYALKKGEPFIPSHRGKAIYPMRGMDLNYFMAGMFGRKEGFGQGRTPTGSHMCGDLPMGMLPKEGLVGSGTVVGVGAALALKLQHKPSAVLIWCGDGGSNRGDVHEGMNFSAALELPVVWYFVNNGWSLSVRSEFALSAKHIADRAVGYGMPGTTIDGRDVLKVYETVSLALENARQGCGPALVEVMVDRWTAHSINDPDLYRTDEERARMRERDPIKEYEAVLEARGFFSNGSQKRVWEQVAAEIEAAVLYADQCTEPDASCMTYGVYEPKG